MHCSCWIHIRSSQPHRPNRKKIFTTTHNEWAAIHQEHKVVQTKKKQLIQSWGGLIKQIFIESTWWRTLIQSGSHEKLPFPSLNRLSDGGLHRRRPSNLFWALNLWADGSGRWDGEEGGGRLVGLGKTYIDCCSPGRAFGRFRSSCQKPNRKIRSDRLGFGKKTDISTQKPYP